MVNIYEKVCSFDVVWGFWHFFLNRLKMTSFLWLIKNVFSCLLELDLDRLSLFKGLLDILQLAVVSLRTSNFEDLTLLDRFLLVTRLKVFLHARRQLEVAAGSVFFREDLTCVLFERFPIHFFFDSFSHNFEDELAVFF